MREGPPSGAPPGDQKRKWVRYEREYSNSMWHAAFRRLPDGGWLVSYMDDASRFITGFGVYGEATGDGALEVLGKAVENHGKPASILTAHGSPFYAGKAERGRRGGAKFETEMVRMGIRHRLAGAGRPQSHGKISRYHGEIKAKLRLFCGMDDFVDWWNNIRPHMSLDWDSLETPARAFARKMPGAGAVAADARGG